MNHTSSTTTSSTVSSTAPRSGPASSEHAAFRFVVAIGSGLHRYGAPVHRLEIALEEIARSLGLRASFLATPTSLMSTAEIEDDQKTHLQRQNSGTVDLGKLAQLDELARLTIAGEIEVPEATARVAQIDQQPARYHAALHVLAFATSSAGFACFLGAQWLEVAAAGAAGLLIGLLALAVGEGRRGSDLFEPLAAFVLAGAVPFLSQWIDISAPTVILAGLIVLVPGLTFTQAVTELAQRNVVSGTSRLFGAVSVFLLLAFGAVLGSALATGVLGEQAAAGAPRHLPLEVLVGAVLVTSLSFLVMFRAEPRHFLPIAVCGLATFLTARTTLSLMPDPESAPLFAAFAGAIVTGLTSNFWARLRRRPALVLRVPAMMHLVPGSLGFRAVALFSVNDAVGGVELVTTMAFIAVAIATGLFVANALVPPRQRL